MLKDKELALRLLTEKKDNPSITYEEIARRSAYDLRSIKRFAADLKVDSVENILRHGNTGHKPALTASESEIQYICKLKESYPNITIVQLRDIYIEDIIDNPDKKNDVEKYSLFPRSLSWFRNLFRNQGWETPASKRIRIEMDHVTHPLRPPMARMGELVQIDGTPFDWFNDGRKFTLHLAVDDATTNVLAGWFMPTECTRGYCRMMNVLLNTYGIPAALYSDNYSVFKSAKTGTSTQFSNMMEDLNIRMIYAYSPEAKGRVERYNETVQLRLPNDIRRYNISDYDQLNIWFNENYRTYLNSKFSFSPRDQHSAFLSLPENYDLSSIFRMRYERQVNAGMISFESQLYYLMDKSGVRKVIGDGTVVKVYRDVFSEKLYVEYYGNTYYCEKADVRNRTNIEGTNIQKDIEKVLRQPGAEE